ncbi:hypothetical protein NXS98_05665 [Fontisphaera persica]|uniref:hypothetical protein n=1 Tax=Fontisphaera persica TaxID=2974023 RepID=UPI0024BF1783|nr:hypothetical protein [Fontisphaera persica]WCJ60617.1 hypothetical protein NXS98_05665 [Fontisphaera persica]
MFVYMVIAFSYLNQGVERSPTAISRLDLMHAIVSERRINIDSYHHNTGDKAYHGGHYYSDKAPGTVALALPAFYFGSLMLKAVDIPLDSDFGWLISSWVACAGSLAIVTALGAVAMFAWLKKRVPPQTALLITAGFFLGAAPLPYATMMFSHSLAVGCIAIALWALDRQTGRCEGAGVGLAKIKGWVRHHRYELLGGFVLGWALASEYTAGLIVVGMIAVLLWGQWWRLWPVGLGALPPLLLIPAYSWACLGTPFALPYSYQASFPVMKEGLYAIKWPDAETGFNLLFSAARGLFFWSPFLLLSLVGCFRLFRQDLREMLLYYFLPVLQVVVISGRVWDWPAGPTLGPRYLAPMLPLLALPCAYGLLRFPKLGTVLVVYSIALTVLATATDACPANKINNPLTHLHIPLFLKGQFSYSIGEHVLGLPPYVSFAVYAAFLAGGLWWLWRRLGREGEASPHAEGVKE